MKITPYIFIAIIALTLSSLGYLYFVKENKQALPEYTQHYQPAKKLIDFQLIDESGKYFTNEQLLNQWTFFFFGYISCPDVCPVTMQNMSFIYDDLKTIAHNSKVILVSVDPNRDSIENLNQYVGYFNPEFKALRAEHDILFPFALSLGLMYGITNKDNAGKSGQEAYWVDHSASIVLVNPKGNIEAVFNPKLQDNEIPVIDSALLVNDYAKIVALYK